MRTTKYYSNSYISSCIQKSMTKIGSQKSNDKWDDVDILFVHLNLVRSITYINWI